MIDLLICATRRSEIVSRTLRSFKAGLFKNHHVNVLLNIDPVGVEQESRFVFHAVTNYFPVRFLRTPDCAGFPAAFKALWLAAAAKYIFWLEDDWELLRDINLDAMIRIMEDEPDLAVLRLPWKPTGQYSMKNWRYFFPWNKRYFECPAELRREVGFCGHPSLIRGEFVQACAPLLDATKNPEKQFHYSAGIVQEVDRWRFGVYGFPNQSPSVRDIGREWMLAHGLRKAGSKAFFTNWERI